MKTINLCQIDAFTDAIFGGNPAGVVTNADELTVDEMQKIAREMNLSETAFVLAPSSKQADVKLRFFTPSEEVRFCGHATVGALFQLARLGMFGLGQVGKNDVSVETGAGILLMTVANEKTTKVTFRAPAVELQPYRLQREAFAKEFGVPVELIDAQGIIHHDQNLNYIYIPALSLRALGEQVFDFAHIRRQFGQEGVIVFCLYSRETANKGADIHARGLAPNIGIDEDPFTGSMQAGLVLSAKENGYIGSDAQTVITEQGNFIERPGSAAVRHSLSSGEIFVTASAAPVFSAEVRF